MDATYKSELEKITEGHIFYKFQDEEVYFNNLVTFIQSGIKNKQQVLIIENMSTSTKFTCNFRNIHMIVNGSKS